MFEKKYLGSLIQEKIHLMEQTASGFRPVKCAVCSDYKVRAAFKFDGTSVGYNCWNCNTKWLFDEAQAKLSKAGWNTLLAFGISKSDIVSTLSSGFFDNSEQVISLDVLKPKINLFTPEIKYPDGFEKISEDNIDHRKFIEYLLARKIDYKKYQIGCCVSGKLVGRCVIPCFRDKKLIFWQARSIDGAEPKYKSPVVQKDAVMWGFDNMWTNWKQPLFVTEGIFDAMFLNGVALLGTDLTPSKVELLNKNKRQKVLVVDNDKNGHRLARIAAEHGFSVSYVPSDVKDVNSSVLKYGKLYTIYHLMSKISSPEAQVKTKNGISLSMELEMGFAKAFMKGT